MKTLKETMKPLGGLAALKLMFKMEGVEVPPANFQMYNVQAIPFKYSPIIDVIEKKHGVNLKPYLRKDNRGKNRVGVIKTIYPETLAKLKSYGLGKVASHINEERNKTDIFAIPPMRFNHFSLEATLSKKLSRKMKDFLIACYDLEKEIEADESAKDILG
jgi:hypothetical protein